MSLATCMDDHGPVITMPLQPRLYDCMHARKDYDGEVDVLVTRLGRTPSRCLDVGCGTGLHAVALARRGADEVIGVDPDQEAIAAARVRAADTDGGERAQFVVGDIRAAGPGPFDLVTMLFNVVNYVGSDASLRDLLHHAAGLSPKLVVFDAWAPRSVDQPDATHASRPFVCDGQAYVLETTLHFAADGGPTCHMTRVVRHESAANGRIVEDVILRMWEAEMLVAVAEAAGFDVTVTSWSAETGATSSAGGPEPLLFICRTRESRATPPPGDSSWA